MQFGDLRPSLKYITDLLKRIDRNTNCAACGNGAVGTTAGTGDVPAGLRSFSLVKTSGSGSVTITMSDSTTYSLTEQGEVFIEAASAGGKLPDYAVVGSGGATWKWHGIK